MKEQIKDILKYILMNYFVAFVIFSLFATVVSIVILGQVLWVLGFVFIMFAGGEVLHYVIKKTIKFIKTKLNNKGE